MESTQIIRLCHSLRPGDTRFPGNPDVQVREKHSYEKGDCCATFEVTFFNHNGTHIDFPRHYVESGKALGDYQMSDFVFDHVAVIHLSAGRGQGLTPDDLRPWFPQLSNSTCLLLRTGYQAYRSGPEFAHGPYITRELAHWIRKELPGLRCIGLDTLSITSLDAFDEGQDVHRILLGGQNAPFVVEDMDLLPLAPYTDIQKLYIAPWFIHGVDGGPCTAFAEVVS